MSNLQEIDFGKDVRKLVEKHCRHDSRRAAAVQQKVREALRKHHGSINRAIQHCKKAAENQAGDRSQAGGPNTTRAIGNQDHEWTLATHALVHLSELIRDAWGDAIKNGHGVKPLLMRIELK